VLEEESGLEKIVEHFFLQMKPLFAAVSLRGG
jgi:hypothetical protein